ncbi:MAG: ThiF family adenylyltransferase [Desulfobacterales bacterium]|jgi:molybdopterin/thiamine biosynthesis adenylyltransferase
MSERFLHENIFRGPVAMKKLAQTSVALCGIGAVGSNLAVNIARQGFYSLILIDRDRVEPHNLGTQVWTEAEVGLFKAECLRNRLFDDLGLEVEARPKALEARSVRKLLKGAALIVDSFDNSDSRNIVKSYSTEAGVPCLHVGLNADYAEVMWNEAYRVPSPAGQDICDYPLARNLIMMAVSVAAESLIRFIINGEKKNYTITLGDFAVKQYFN